MGKIGAGEIMENVFMLGEEGDFESLGKENGTRYWYATDLIRFLGYGNSSALKPVINRAIAACMSADMDVLGNFRQHARTLPSGKVIGDYKLSRFGCYLVAMNADPRKPNVARAQVYFAAIAETVRQHFEQIENVERVIVRSEISDREKSLSGVAKAHGVTVYPLFQNAGYRGLYNMDLGQLKEVKGLEDVKRSLLDFMGKDELAANLFRITQTEAKIKNEEIRGQGRLESAAESVGAEVRQTMIKISGTRPEDLPLAEDLRVVKSELKKTQRKFHKLDTPKPESKKPKAQ